MSWMDTLSQLWNTPSIDFSDPMTEDFISTTQSESILETAFSTHELLWNEALDQAELLQTAEKDNIQEVLIVGDDTVQDADGKFYKIKNINGVTQFDLFVSASALASTTDPSDRLNFDITDQQDYNNRYVSIDSPFRRNDSRDIAFFRIVTNDLNHTSIFPNFDGYPQPGITRNKFKQFILLQLNESSKERMQIVETNQDFQLLFFNKKPEFLSISGVLKNTIDNPWNVNMIFLWDNLMRGTKLVENGWILQFYADGQLYYGYPFEFNRSKIAPTDYTVQFNFMFVTTERINLYNTDSTLSQAAMTVKTN